MSYDPVVYWTDRGRSYAVENPSSWSAEDTALTALLGDLRVRSVLDLGCGYGRVAATIHRIHPFAAYTGLDVSPDLAATTRDRLGSEVICADLATFTTRRKWDLVLAVSVLGHLLPADVPAVLARMRSWARRDLIVMDWDETGSSTSYQYAHDYRALMPTASRTPSGRLSIYHERLR